MRHVWTAIRDRVASLRRSVPLSSPTTGVVSDAARTFFTEAYWIVFGREILPLELRGEARGFRDNVADSVARRLVTSSEFGELYAALKEHGELGLERGARTARDRALSALGSDEHFIRRAYRLLFRRDADDRGLQHYLEALSTGDSRTDVLRSLIVSDEFEWRYREVAPEAGFVPRDTQLCELANPAKWDNAEWLSLLRDLGERDDKPSMHRKSYEFTQLLYGLHKLGWLRDDVSVLSVGAGHERVLYWLANHVGRVVATDLYEGEWQSACATEGDEAVLRDADEYAPFPYRKERLTFVRMDGRRLTFKDHTFDVAYSLSSIEHFGGFDGARAALDEMARVTKRGGLVVLATEYVLAGPPHEETFQPAEFASLIDRPGLRLVQPLDDRVYDRYEYAAVDVHKNPYQTPHMVVRFGDTAFTSVMVFLRKE